MLHARLNGWVVVIALLAAVVPTNGASAQEEPAGAGAFEEALLVPAEAPPVAVEEAVEEAERIVVTATRTEQEVGEVANSVTVITAEDIEAGGFDTALDALVGVPSVNVARTGLGRQSSVFLRGANSAHTLVLVDGIKINNPIDPGRAPDLAHLTTDNVERIEVIRGPMSTLYGSDALGGVINIITKKGRGAPSYSVYAEGGSFGTFREGLTASGGSDKLNYSLAVSRLETDGISALNAADGNTENDGYTNTTVSGRFGYEVNDAFGIDLVLRHIDTESEIDDFGGDDPNHFNRTNKLFVSASARLKLLDGGWNQKITVQRTDQRREDIDGPDIVFPAEFPSETSFTGRMTKVDWQNTVEAGENNKLLFGVEFAEEEAFSTWQAEDRARTTGVYIEDQFGAGGLVGTAGVRLDSHDEFGSATTYRVTAAKIFEETGTRLRATVGSGFKAPSLYQLYDPSSGNAELDPEESTSWDIGVEQKLLEDRVALALTYYDTDFTNLLEWVWTGPGPWDGHYLNVGEAEAKGVEALATFRHSDALSVTASYIFTDATDADGEMLLKRPKHRYGLNVAYRFSEKGRAGFGVSYTSDRLDYGGKVMEQYTLANLSASYRVSENGTVHVRIENLFDEEYEEVAGYGTRGFSVHVGAKATF